MKKSTELVLVQYIELQFQFSLLYEIQEGFETKS